MKIYILLLCLFLVISTKANAKFFLEPYVGLGKSTSEEIQYPDVTFDNFSINPGLKFGTSTMLRLITAGVDVSHQSSTVEGDSSEDDALERMDYALFVGFDLPILFRAWAKYIFISGLNIGDAEILGSSGYGFGVGYTGLPLLNLNLEYRNLSWNKVRINGNENNRDGNISEFILSLSFPLKL